ncbi:MAG: hypothetical protein ACJAVK_001859 [Akkermansiaceae bacterium]
MVGLNGSLLAISDLPAADMQEVFGIATKAGLKVYRWQADLMPREIRFDEVSRSLPLKRA